MLAKESANQMADAIIEAKAAPMRKKRRERLERRYTWAFGDAFVSRCLENLEASELAIRKTQNQWQFVLLFGSCLGAFVACMAAEQYFIGNMAILFGGVICRKLSLYYARKHFNALDT